MEFTLTPDAVRVLGSLVEKDITTPDYYPLSLNALVNACNQKSNREPVMLLDEDRVRDALSELQGQRLAGPSLGADTRVTKYEHRLQEVFNFMRSEMAVVCVLLLRGPQTPGELRTRTERMHRFDALDEVQSTLQKLMQRDPPLAKVLPRQPGTKESRYAHLLAGDVAGEPPPSAATGDHGTPFAASGRADAERVEQLQNEVAELREQVAEMRLQVSDLKDQLERFRRQFE
jgi:uncharacterized protein